MVRSKPITPDAVRPGRDGEVMMTWKMRTLDRDEWAEATRLLSIVGERYPVLGAHPAKPLAIGTGDQLKTRGREIGLTEEQVGLVMVRVVRTSKYLAALARGGSRYDLDGAIAGEVTSSERIYAARVLAKRRERRLASGSPAPEESGDASERSEAAGSELKPELKSETKGDLAA